MRETWVQSLIWEGILEKRKATHFSILAWRIPWTIQSMGSQSVRHDWTTFTHSRTILNLKTYHNMLWFPAVNHGIKGHRCEPLWLKSSPRKGRMDAMVAYLEFGGAEIKGSERRGQRSPGQWGPKRKFPFCSRGPKLSLGPGGASLRSRLLSTATREFSPWIWSPRWQRCTWRRVPLGGRCRSVSYWEIGRPLPATGAQKKEFGGLWRLIVQDLNCFTEAQVKGWISGLLASLLMVIGRLCSIPHISPVSLGRLLFFLSFPKFI